MRAEIYKQLQLTAVGSPAGVTLPRPKFVSEVLERQLDDIGMPQPGGLEVGSDFKPRDRNEKEDPSYSLEKLRESQKDLLGLYCTDLRKAEITLFVDTCARLKGSVFIA